MIQLYGANKDLIVFNELSWSGLICSDLGMVYQWGRDGNGTRVAYNWIHDNKASMQGDRLGPGIYNDNYCKDFIDDHNVIWNCEAAVRLNQPNNNIQVYNNTGFNCSDFGSFSYNQYPNYMPAYWVYGNISTSILKNNLFLGTNPASQLQNPSANNFSLLAGSSSINVGEVIAGFTDGYLGTKPDLGAYESGGIVWKPGRNGNGYDAIFNITPTPDKWTWEIFPYNTDVWFRSYNAGIGKFDFRLGGGGCIANMRYCPDNYRSLLSPTAAGEETDRVMQSVYWGFNAVDSLKMNGTLDPRYNINQAGYSDGGFAQTLAVNYYNQNTIEVYSLSKRQWYPTLDSEFGGQIASINQYELLNKGIIKVTKYLKSPNATYLNKPIPNFYAYIEQWLPFLKGGTNDFDGLAFGLDNTGTPSWWYNTSNIPSYPQYNVATNSNGYAMVYNTGALGTHVNISVVLGKKAPEFFNSTATGYYEFNSMQWNTGIGILPGLHASNIEPGSLIVIKYYIVPAEKSDAQLKTTLDSLVGVIENPKIYGPSYNFQDDLLKKMNILHLIESGTGLETNHLANLVATVDDKLYTQSLSLQKGWNLLSFSVAPTNTTIDTVFSSVKANVDEIKNASSFWKSGQLSNFNSLQQISVTSSYLVNMKSAATLTVQGNVIGPISIPVSTGWNMIGVPSLTPANITTKLSIKPISSVKSFDGFWLPSGTLNSISNFEPGKGYFIKSMNATIISY
jgi:hypothetical protein